MALELDDEVDLHEITLELKIRGVRKVHVLTFIVYVDLLAGRCWSPCEAEEPVADDA
jgi:hypothetical protein